MSGSDEDPRGALDLARRIAATAEALERLRTGALVAFAGGATVVGAVAGGVFWMPAVMAYFLLVYRAGLSGFAFPEWRMQQRLRQHDQVRERIADLYRSALPPATVELLVAALVSELESSMRRRALPPAAGGVRRNDADVGGDMRSLPEAQGAPRDAQAGGGAES